jgi:hypothetical protein
MRVITVSTLVSARILQSIAKISAKFGRNTLLTPYMYVRVARLRTYTLYIGIEWFWICPSQGDTGVSTKILGLVSCWSQSRSRYCKCLSILVGLLVCGAAGGGRFACRAQHRPKINPNRASEHGQKLIQWHKIREGGYFDSLKQGKAHENIHLVQRRLKLIKKLWLPIRFIN